MKAQLVKVEKKNYNSLFLRLTRAKSPPYTSLPDEMYVASERIVKFRISSSRILKMII